MGFEFRPVKTFISVISVQISYGKYDTTIRSTLLREINRKNYFPNSERMNVYFCFSQDKVSSGLYSELHYLTSNLALVEFNKLCYEDYLE